MGSTPPQGSSEGGLDGDDVHAEHETKVEDTPNRRARAVSEIEGNGAAWPACWAGETEVGQHAELRCGAAWKGVG